MPPIGDTKIVLDAFATAGPGHTLHLECTELEWMGSSYAVHCSCGGFDETSLLEYRSAQTDAARESILQTIAQRHRRQVAGQRGVYACGCTAAEGASSDQQWKAKHSGRPIRPRKTCARHGEPYLAKTESRYQPSRLSSSDVLDRLAPVYPASADKGEWIFVRELRVGTGAGSHDWDARAGELVHQGWEQRLDAFALGCWPSTKFARIAFEVKVSRSDFLSEIRDPTKRAAALRLANQFYFVTPKGLVAPEEIPPECGLIEVGERGGRTTVVEAPWRDVDEAPVRFVASLVRHAVRAAHGLKG